jgi:LacI family transcriptional regulator
MRQTRHVALMLPLGWESAEPIRRGVARYARERGGWTLAQAPEWWHSGPRALLHWRGNGALAELRTEREARLAAQAPYPVVNLLSTLPPGGPPRVVTDNRAVGRLGAKHFLERGFVRCVFYGLPRCHYAAERLAGFRECLEQAGAACAFFPAPGLRASMAQWQRHRERLDAFLRALTPPVAVMACDDMRARLVIEACTRLGRPVPEAVAVLGVDNLPVTCEFCVPPLSSVQRDIEQEGYAAARLLDELMAGRRAAAGDRLIAPVGVVARRSTETLALEDAEARRAVEFMRANLARPFGMAELAAEAGISRRWLESRFREALGVTLHQYLCRLRVDAAKRLLTLEPRAQLQQIAARCGFADARRLRLVFERVAGMTPRAYRRRECSK